MHYPSRQTIFCVCRSICITEDSSPRWMMHLVPIFLQETNNQMNNECLPKFVKMDNAVSSITTAIFIIIVLLFTP